MLFKKSKNLGADGRLYKTSFVILTAIGVFMLVSSTLSQIIEMFLPQLQGQLASGFLLGAVLCLFIASLHYAKYLNSSK